MTPLATASRLSFYYAALFTAVGIHMPFWPLWLQDKGMSAAQIGLIMAATYLTKILVGPGIGHVVDRHGDRRRPMLVLSALAAFTWLAFPLVDGFWPILVVTVLAVGLWTGIFPLGESLSMMETQRQRLDYGRVRLWGSLTFIGAAIATGNLLTHQPPSILSWMVAAALALTAFSCWLLPSTAVAGRGRPRLPLGPLLKHPLFLVFLAVTSLNTASHTVYYAFATIHWQAAGLDGDTIGLLWAEGVLAEVVLFAFSGRVVARIGPGRLLLLATAAGILRWLALGASTAVPVLAAAQVLHAATFGCAHLGAMHFITRAIPHALSARAQGMFSAVAMGAAPGLMSPLAGRLYESLGGDAFYVMVGLSAAGTALALVLARRWMGQNILAQHDADAAA